MRPGLVAGQLEGVGLIGQVAGQVDHLAAGGRHHAPHGLVEIELLLGIGLVKTAPAEALGHVAIHRVGVAHGVLTHALRAQRGDLVGHARVLQVG